MNERGKRLNHRFNSKHVQPLKPHKAAQAPNPVTKTNPPHRGADPKARIPKGPCPKGGGGVCHCHPKTIPKH